MEPVCLQVLNSGSAEVQVAPTEQDVPFAHMAPAVVVVTPPVKVVAIRHWYQLAWGN